jgi:predicted deacylase
MVMEIARRYGGGNFRGRLLLLPVANPLAFEAYSRNTPLDAQNMNRLFPGHAGGRITEQLVALITRRVPEHDRRLHRYSHGRPADRRLRLHPQRRRPVTQFWLPGSIPF